MVHRHIPWIPSLFLSRRAGIDKHMSFTWVNIGTTEQGMKCSEDRIKRQAKKKRDRQTTTLKKLHQLMRGGGVQSRFGI